MRTLRRHLPWIVGAWLVCQVATLTAAPLVLAGGSAHAEGLCTCPIMGPGAVCPMHRSHQEAAGGPGEAGGAGEAGEAGEKDTKKTADCVLSSGNQPAIPTLTSIIGGIGLIPPAQTALTTVITAELGPAISAAVLARSDRPESPPPRPSLRSVDIA